MEAVMAKGWQVCKGQDKAHWFLGLKHAPWFRSLCGEVWLVVLVDQSHLADTVKRCPECEKFLKRRALQGKPI